MSGLGLRSVSVGSPLDVDPAFFLSQFLRFPVPDIYEIIRKDRTQSGISVRNDLTAVEECKFDVADEAKIIGASTQTFSKINNNCLYNRH